MNTNSKATGDNCKKPWLISCKTFLTPSCFGQKQWRYLSVFESSFHQINCLPYTMEASHSFFNCWTSGREAVSTNFYSLWFDLTRNDTALHDRNSYDTALHNLRYCIVWYGTVLPKIAFLIFVFGTCSYLYLVHAKAGIVLNLFLNSWVNMNSLVFFKTCSYKNKKV